MRSLKSFVSKMLRVVLVILVCLTWYPSAVGQAEKITVAQIQSNSTSAAAITPPVQVLANFGRLPLYFIPNRGQVNKKVLYYTTGGGQTAFFTSKEIVLSLSQPEVAKSRKPSVLSRAPKAKKPAKFAVVRLQPLGSNRRVRLEGLEVTSHRVNYFLGNDPKKWRTDIPTYRAVIYKNLYEGIDLKFYGQGRQLEYDLVVQPGADPTQVRFAYQGLKKLEVTPEGDLALILPDGGRLLQKKPVVYQEIGGQRLLCEGRYQVQRRGAQLTWSILVADYDRSQPLVIDPVLTYSTYLGGSWSDLGLAIAVDQFGCAYVTGRTDSSDFPKQNPLQNFILGAPSAFVTKLNPAGNGLVYSTFLGGLDWDLGQAIAVDADGQAIVTGETSSPDFPTHQAYQNIYGGGGSDVFITKLSAAGNALIYSTFLGGYGYEEGRGIAVDPSGAAYVTGRTNSRNFPVRMAYNGELAGDFDAFVCKLTAAGELVFSTYLGGSNFDAGRAIAVYGGWVYVSGITDSPDFPIKEAYQRTLGGDLDVFFTVLHPTGNALYSSTYLGGRGRDLVNGITLDPYRIILVGATNSDNFPCHNAFQSTFGGGEDAFITKFELGGRSLIFSSYLGRNGYDSASGVTANQSGEIYVTGITGPVYWSGSVLVAKVSPTGKLLYLTSLGPGSGCGIACDPSGAIYVCGYTHSRFFPTVNAYQGVLQGSNDAFITKLVDGGSIEAVLELLLIED